MMKPKKNVEGVVNQIQCITTRIDAGNGCSIQINGLACIRVSTPVSVGRAFTQKVTDDERDYIASLIVNALNMVDHVLITEKFDEE